MSYEEKLARVRALLEGHNSNIPEDAKVDIDAFFNKLKAMGGTSESVLAQATWEDLENCGLPRILARQVANEIFREPTPPEKNEPTIVKVDLASSDPAAHAAQLKPAQVVEYYDPDNHTNPYGARLKDVTDGEDLLAFEVETGAFNVELTKQLVQEYVDGHAPPAGGRYKDDGKWYELYSVGESPGKFAPENPLFPGEALRPGDKCPHTQKSWAGVSDETRRIVYNAVTTGELVIADKDKARDIIALAKADPAELADRYDGAVILLGKQNRGDEPKPSMRVPLGSKSGGKQRKANPFGEGTNVTY